MFILSVGRSPTDLRGNEDEETLAREDAEALLAILASLKCVLRDKGVAKATFWERPITARPKSSSLRYAV